MRYLTALALVMLPATASTQAWRSALTAAAMTSLWIDAAQTLHGLRYGMTENHGPLLGIGPDLLVNRPWHEVNPILGPHPRSAAVTLYFTAAAAANLWAPRKIRPVVNAATLLLEVITIKRNARVVGFRLTP